MCLRSATGKHQNVMPEMLKITNCPLGIFFHSVTMKVVLLNKTTQADKISIF